MAIKAKITASSIKGLTPEDKRLNDNEVSGFHVRITPKGLISYYLFYRLHGKQVNYKLGVHGQITPAQARDFAKDKLAEVTKGIDVQAIKKQEASTQSKLSFQR